MAETKLSKNETIKRESNYLRGSLIEEVQDATLSHIGDDSKELLKFHGSYQQFDRDTQTERKKQGLDKEWQFMVRMKCPGGQLTAEQYLAMDEVCERTANGTLRLTTRETFQFHGVLKGNLKQHIADINKALLSTLATCGDVVRNVMACPAPIKDDMHARLSEDCFALARHFTPKTKQYVEMWLDGEKIDSPINAPDAGTKLEEPIYGETYLPRKFKIGIAPAHDNCIDVLTHDLAIVPFFDEQQRCEGYNICMGGGHGMTHNKAETYPRLATPIAFAPADKLLEASTAVIELQRDHGDRTNRKHARLKYVVEEKGTDWTRATLEKYYGSKMADPRDMGDFHVEDHMGWHPQGDGKWFLGIPVPSGRIADSDLGAYRTGLRAIIKEYGMPVRLTADQNILLCDIEEGEKPAIEALLAKHRIKRVDEISRLDRWFMACVAYPTCGLALAEAERVRDPMRETFEQLLAKHDMSSENISLRVTGCPNGCARPYNGDIGLVGRTPGTYAVFIGGDFEGTRLNSKIFDRVPYEHLSDVFDPMFALYQQQQTDDEGFGDFCDRVGVETVKKAATDVLSEKYKWAV